MQAETSQALTVLTDNSCQICGHHRNAHFKRLEGQETLVPCVHPMGGSKDGLYDCKCPKYCGGFTPKESSTTGLDCTCGEPVFVHQRIVKALGMLNESQSNKVLTMRSEDVPYKVVHQSMKLCCLWTIYHHMRTTKDHSVMQPGYAIECPMCQRVGRLEVVEDTFVIGPTWKFAYRKK